VSDWLGYMEHTGLAVINRCFGCHSQVSDWLGDMEHTGLAVITFVFRLQHSVVQSASPTVVGSATGMMAGTLISGERLSTVVAAAGTITLEATRNRPPALFCSMCMMCDVHPPSTVVFAATQVSTRSPPVNTA
jgi:hypothetical protein